MLAAYDLGLEMYTGSVSTIVVKSLFGAGFVRETVRN